MKISIQGKSSTHLSHDFQCVQGIVWQEGNQSFWGGVTVLKKVYLLRKWIINENFLFGRTLEHDLKKPKKNIHTEELTNFWM